MGQRHHESCEVVDCGLGVGPRYEGQLVADPELEYPSSGSEGLGARDPSGRARVGEVVVDLEELFVDFFFPESNF